ncbi:MAG: Zn-dependent protease with chaperone function [Verrucomicrobia bacterium]|nr:MAG: Zn-dependent protease with chaperone function [Verrucomicrobiota bacterium]
MDFFEAQARAKQRTGRLVALFVVAVIGTILGGYFATIFLLAYSPTRPSRHQYYQSDNIETASVQLWQPQVFLTVTVGTLLVVGIASLVKWQEFSAGGSAVAESVGGRPINPHTTDLRERKLLNVVEEMAIASGIPMPAVYVLDQEPAINAFAAGLTTSDAVVTVTRGALDKLTRDELQGVIGHEFSHILNGDMRLNLQLSALLFGILVIGLAGRGILWALTRGRIRSSDSKGSGGVVLAAGAVGLALLILGYVGYFFGKLIQAAVSRQREYLADASSVQFTRNPGGLTGALKKIGGFALGSSLESNKSATIGHFFFAQAFESSFGGLWATHPSLDSRLRAIDPQFDGQMFDPPEVVDVSHDTFAQAGFAPGALDHSTVKRPAAPLPSPVAIIATIGTLAPANIAHAETLLASVPPRLREATRSPTESSVLLYGLLLDGHETMRERQRSLVASKAGAEARRLLGELEPALGSLGPEHKLPLLQLAVPALRNLPPASLAPFLDTLDELVHADGKVSTFEFALQKLLTRSLALGEKPGAAVVQVYSFNAVAHEISVVLSALAYTASNGGLDAAGAFAAGTDQLKLLEGQLALLPPAASDFVALDAALDKLATASGPIKQRLLFASAHVVGADGTILIAEAELLRAIAAALDCPMPPIQQPAAA